MESPKSGSKSVEIIEEQWQPESPVGAARCSVVVRKYSSPLPSISSSDSDDTEDEKTVPLEEDNDVKKEPHSSNAVRKYSSPPPSLASSSSDDDDDDVEPRPKKMKTASSQEPFDAEEATRFWERHARKMKWNKYYAKKRDLAIRFEINKYELVKQFREDKWRVEEEFRQMEKEEEKEEDF